MPRHSKLFLAAIAGIVGFGVLPSLICHVSGTGILGTYLPLIVGSACGLYISISYFLEQERNPRTIKEYLLFAAAGTVMAFLVAIMFFGLGRILRRGWIGLLMLPTLSGAVAGLLACSVWVRIRKPAG